LQTQAAAATALATNLLFLQDVMPSGPKAVRLMWQPITQRGTGLSMAVRISRTDAPEVNRTLLRVQGSLTQEGADWLERKCLCLLHGAGHSVVIDLAEVTFMDEAGAVVLRRLRRHPSVSLVGCQLFTRQMIEAVDPV
jgi:anti-anti-sigma regulatory factor